MSATDPCIELEYPLENERQPAAQYWSENYALVMGDPESGVALLYSAGTWYQDPRIWRENLVISLPDGSILVSRNFGRRPPCQAVGASLSRYEVLQPLAQARLQFDGPATGHDLRGLLHAGAIGGRTHRVQLAALFAAGAPMWDMHAGDGHDATSIAGSMHIEQLGRCDGELVVDGRSYAIRGAQSCRDHSRGVRNVAPYRNHCWINGQFAGGRGFQLYVFRMHGIEGLALSRAVITEQGRQHPATVEEIEFVESTADIERRSRAEAAQRASA
ncbi:MAG: hypothetical protein U1F11_07040 [Steroidobacteraceae bacterium]